MKNFEDIDRYLNNKMTADERTAFEARVMADHNLAHELEVQRAEEDLLDAFAENELLKRIKQFEEVSENPGEKTPKTRSSKLYYWSTAAVIAIIATIFITIQILIKTDSPDSFVTQLYNDFPPKLRRTTRNPATKETTNLDTILTAFAEGNDITDIIRDLESIQQQTNIATYYLGHAHYKAGDFAIAADKFKVYLTVSTNDSLEEEAMFYAIISSVKAGRLKDAIELIDNSTISNNPLKERLLELRNLLEG